MKNQKRSLEALECICGHRHFQVVFNYNAPPLGEIRFPFSDGAGYLRTIFACRKCGHFLSVHEMNDASLYSGDYLTSTYGDENGIKKAFDRINALPPEKSDNVGRVNRIIEFSKHHFPNGEFSEKASTILDVGSGLCVFLSRIKTFGWQGTALDPDPRFVLHAKQNVGVQAIQGDFLKLKDLGSFDFICFNKVLEHVRRPVQMLAHAKKFLKKTGIVYVELPDGEAAREFGPGREEFFIDHHHIFSPASLSILASKAGFDVVTLERLHEPSTKYTLRAFLKKT